MTINEALEQDYIIGRDIDTLYPFEAIKAVEGNEHKWEYLNFVCRAVRWNGHWCGYVGVGTNNYLYKKNYTNRIKYKDWIDLPASPDENGSINLFLFSFFDWQTTVKDDKISLTMILQCHGGLSFAGRHRNFETRGKWYFGFDCAHAGDYTRYGEEVEEILTPIMKEYRLRDKYWTLTYVKKQVNNLAEQLIYFNKDEKGIPKTRRKRLQKPDQRGSGNKG